MRGPTEHNARRHPQRARAPWPVTTAETVTTTAPSPLRSRRGPRPDAPSSKGAAWTRTSFSHRSWVAAAPATAGALAVVSVLPLRHWPRPSLIALLVRAGAAVVNAGVRVAIGERLPRWSLQVDVGLGNGFVSLIVPAGMRGRVDLANLYLPVELFALLYLPLRAALAHLGTAGATYAVILGTEPLPVEPPLIAWLAVFGTAAALGAVVVGLVGVLRVVAREDPLTGLANRRSWDERLEEELARAGRSGAALSVVVVDLGDFKAVNDAVDHQAGDRLLRALAASWRNVVRGGGDLLARLGGDELGLLAPGSDPIGVHELAARLVDALPRGSPHPSAPPHGTGPRTPQTSCGGPTGPCARSSGVAGAERRTAGARGATALSRSSAGAGARRDERWTAPLASAWPS